MGRQLIVLLGAVLSASFLGVALFFAVRGVGKTARRRWRPGSFDLGISFGLTLLGLVMIGVVGFAMVNGAEVDPPGRARVLAEFIAAALNWGALVGAVAICAGLFDAVWVQQKRTPHDDSRRSS